MNKVSDLKQEFRIVDRIYLKRFLQITMLVAGLLFMSLNVYAQPTASITGDAIVCQGSPSPLVTFTGSGGTSPYTFTYNIDGGANQEITTEPGNSVMTLSVSTDSPGTVIYNLVSVADAGYGPQPASGSATVTVTANSPVSLSISASATTICAGTSVTFTALPGNGGISPVYQWYLNGGAVGSNQATYTNATLVNGDNIYCVLTVADLCVTGSPAISNSIVLVVNPVPEAITGTTAICTGSSTKLDSTSSGGIWSSSNTSVATITPSGVVHGVAAGTSEIRYTFGTGCYASTTFTINSLPAPTFTEQPGSTTCSDIDVTYSTQSGQVNYIWGYSGTPGIDYTIASGGGAADYTVTLRWLTSGSKTVTINYTTAMGCTVATPASSTATSVSLSGAVGISIAATPAGAVCSGTSVTYIATSINGGTTPAYQWQVNGLPVGTNSVSYTYVPANSDIVTCILTSNASCSTDSPATSNSITMTVNPLPAAAGVITGTAAVCQGATSVAYSVGTITNATSYTWTYSGTEVTISGSTSSITINFATNATSGNLTVYGVNTCGSGIVSANYPITLSANVTPTFTQLGPYCVGAIPGTLPTTSLNGITGTWLPTTVGTTTAETTTYTFTPTAGQCATTTSMDVVVNSLPTVSITGTSSICVGSTTTLSPTTGGTWVSNSPAVASVTAGGTVTGLTTGSSTFTFTATATGCSSTTTAVTINATNEAGAASSTPTLCISTALTPITHTTTGAIGIGTPSNLPGGVSASWTSNVITISGTPSTSGIFNYSIPLTGGCGTINATGTITVTPNKTVSAASSTPTLCINTTLTAITHTTSGATGIGAATGLPSGVLASWAANTITITGTPTGAGTFNYTIPLTGGCGIISATGTITVTSANTITLTSAVGTNNQTRCISTAIANITYSTTGATGATFSGLPTGVSGGWASNVVTISGTPTVAGTYNYTVTLTGGCGAVTANGTITVNALPVTSVITGNATPPCSAVGLIYSVTNTSLSTYSWTVPTGSNIVGGQGTSSITVNFGTTNGNVTVTETNAAGCVGTTRTLAINLQGCGLDANFNGTPRIICVGSSVTFTSTSTGTTGGTAYNWNFGSGGTPGTANTIGPHTVTYNTTGLKTVSLTITEGASNTEAQPNYITVNPVNTITLTSGAGTNNQTVCTNTAITTITYSTTSATGATITGLPPGVNGNWAANVVTISGVPTTSGTYNYTVTLTGGCGAVSANGTINVNTCTKTLNLTLFLEGLYNGANGLVKVQDCDDGENSFDLFAGIVADTLTVELAQTTSPYTTVFRQHGVPINTNGTVSLTSVPGGLAGNYYIIIKHRNHVETWSQSTSFSGSTINYNFTDAISKAWGNNMVLVGSSYCIYTGDTNMDEYVDGFDIVITFNLNKLASFGFQVSDINGDGFIDGFDMIKVFNNNKKAVGMNTPLAPLKK